MLTNSLWDDGEKVTQVHLYNHCAFKGPSLLFPCKYRWYLEARKRGLPAVISPAMLYRNIPPPDPGRALLLPELLARG